MAKRQTKEEPLKEEPVKDLVVQHSTEPGELTVQQVALQVAKLKELMNTVLIESDPDKGIDGHYGLVPGCGPKPALLKSGAEKILFMFRIRPIINPGDIEVQELDDGHRTYTVHMHMVNRDGQELATGIGICSTMEGKYRYRWQNTQAPVPQEYWKHRDQDLLGGDSYGPRKIDGNWVIFQKVEHDNPADYYNTAIKMAKKRAMVDGTLSATAASDFFTQDIDEEAPASGSTKKQEPKQETKKETKKETTGFGESKQETKKTPHETTKLGKLQQELKDLIDDFVRDNELGPEVKAEILQQLTQYDAYVRKADGKNVPGFAGILGYDFTKVSDKMAAVAIGKFKEREEAARQQLKQKKKA